MFITDYYSTRNVFDAVSWRHLKAALRLDVDTLIETVSFALLLHALDLHEVGPVRAKNLLSGATDRTIDTCFRHAIRQNLRILQLRCSYFCLPNLSHHHLMIFYLVAIRLRPLEAIVLMDTLVASLPSAELQFKSKTDRWDQPALLIGVRLHW